MIKKIMTTVLFLFLLQTAYSNQICPPSEQIKQLRLTEAKILIDFWLLSPNQTINYGGHDWYVYLATDVNYNDNNIAKVLERGNQLLQHSVLAQPKVGQENNKILCEFKNGDWSVFTSTVPLPPPNI